MPLLEPKEFKTKDMTGKDRTYILSKIPASYSKEIVLEYPTSAMPKIGDINRHMEVTLKLMSYVGVPRKGPEPLPLTTRELCDNHIPDLQTWMAVERAMAQYNWGFFLPEDVSLFWVRIKLLLAQWNQGTSTDSSPSSSPQEKPLSMN